MKRQFDHRFQILFCASLFSMLVLLSGCERSEFDTAFGLDDTWAAEKHLISLLQAEGFHNGFAQTNRRSSDGAVIIFATASESRELAHYALSASQNSPESVALISIARRIGPDRLSAINEAIREFNTTKKPAFRQKSAFTQRGEFRVRVNESSIELDNLWRAKRGL